MSQIKTFISTALIHLFPPRSKSIVFGYLSAGSPNQCVSGLSSIAFAIDDNPETHWFGDPALKYPKTIDLDLGRKRCINAVEINVFIWDIPLKLEVHVSDDGHEWRKVSDEVVLKEGAKFEVIEFPETTGRYVRINELAGKRPYGALSEIKVSASRQGATGTQEEAKLTIENVFGSAGLEKYYEINGKRVYLEIDGDRK